tara:strand:- start:281 stop:517 length:237 start_codon:yes stop_codon:yes gene_type:complete
MKITVGELKRIIREEAGEGEEVDMSKLPRGFDPLVDKPVDYNSTLYAVREEKKAKGTTARLKRLLDMLRHFRKGRRLP